MNDHAGVSESYSLICMFRPTNSPVGLCNVLCGESFSTVNYRNKKLSYCWETVRRESMPRIAEVDVEMTT